MLSFEEDLANACARRRRGDSLSAADGGGRCRRGGRTTATGSGHLEREPVSKEAGKQKTRTDHANGGPLGRKNRRRVNSARLVDLRVPVEPLIANVDDLLDVDLLVEDDLGLGRRRSEGGEETAHVLLARSSAKGGTRRRHDAVLSDRRGHLAVELVAVFLTSFSSGGVEENWGEMLTEGEAACWGVAKLNAREVVAIGVP